jgi:hypothetical protein
MDPHKLLFIKQKMNAQFSVLCLVAGGGEKFKVQHQAHAKMKRQFQGGIMINQFQSLDIITQFKLLWTDKELKQPFDSISITVNYESTHFNNSSQTFSWDELIHIEQGVIIPHPKVQTYRGYCSLEIQTFSSHNMTLDLCGFITNLKPQLQCSHQKPQSVLMNFAMFQELPAVLIPKVLDIPISVQSIKRIYTTSGFNLRNNHNFKTSTNIKMPLTTNRDDVMLTFRGVPVHITDVITEVVVVKALAQMISDYADHHHLLPEPRIIQQVVRQLPQVGLVIVESRKIKKTKAKEFVNMNWARVVPHVMILSVTFPAHGHLRPFAYMNLEVHGMPLFNDGSLDDSWERKENTYSFTFQKQPETGLQVPAFQVLTTFDFSRTHHISLFIEWKDWTKEAIIEVSGIKQTGVCG